MGDSGVLVPDLNPSGSISLLLMFVQFYHMVPPVIRARNTVLMCHKVDLFKGTDAGLWMTLDDPHRPWMTLDDPERPWVTLDNPGR